MTYRRRAILCELDTVALLREAFATVKQRHPFRIDVVVILPDHLHAIWTLPPDDVDYSTRWMRIKFYFTRCCAASLKIVRSPALQRNREQTIWQHRYWEHQIRDDRDFERHFDYIHTIRSNMSTSPAWRTGPIRAFTASWRMGRIRQIGRTIPT